MWRFARHCAPNSSLGLPQPNDAAISRVSPSSFGEKFLKRFEGRAAADNGHQDGRKPAVTRHEGNKNAGVAVAIPGTASPMAGSATLTDAQAADLMAGKWYVNVHTAANKDGEIRGQVVKGK